MPTDNRPIVLFDGVCNLCNAAVNYVIDHDPEAYFRLGALQSGAAIELLKEAGLPQGFDDSIILIDGPTLHIRSDAVVRIARRLKGPARFLWWTRVIPRFLRDPVYRFVARFRYDWFGRQDSCRVPTPELLDRFIGPEAPGPVH